MASIRDVAKFAGVSTATVSNVLNGRSDRVSSDTRERVLAAVRQLKYRPTPLEHKQKAILTQNIGVVVPDLTEGPLVRHGYFRNVLDGVLETAALRAWSVTIFVQRMWDDVGNAVRRSYDGRCDGLILVAPQPGNEVVQTLQERGTPLVLVGSTPWLSNVSSVDLDNFAVGSQAARRLIALNHRRLAYLRYGYEQISSVERGEGFFREARQAGIADEDVLSIAVTHRNMAELDGENIVRQLLAMPDPPTGLFCWHDGLGLKVSNELARFGFRVPEQFSILSVDDAPEALEARPHLTSVKNPLHEIGKRAAKMLIDKLVEGGDAAEIVRFAPEWTVRESAGPAPARSINLSLGIS
jgi:DNA-binding LacI/PurR family transcriptional regulator